MGLETATYISDLVTTNPLGTDAKSQGDDHLRLLKSTIKATFPGVTGAVTPTHTELNYVDGVTSAIQTQLDVLTSTKGAHAGQAWTGGHDFTGATISVPTASPGDSDASAASTAFVAAGLALKGDLTGASWSGTHAFTGTANLTGATVTVPTQAAADNTTKAASTAFVQQVAFSAALPNQGGNGGKYLTTDGSGASWVAAAFMPDVIIQDRKASGTNGSNIAGGSWATRELNTIVRNSGSIASLSSNTVTLPAGTWLLRARLSAAPQSLGTGGSSSSITPKLRNTTDGSDIAFGENFQIALHEQGVRAGSVGEVSAVITFAASKSIQVMQFTQNGVGVAAPMAGIASSNGTAEVYCTFEATRVS